MADRRLQVFHAVAKHLSFTKAADELLMTQPAVTFQIKQLEEQYNARLFERGHGRIALTATGAMVLSYVERILHLHDELDGRLADLTSEMRGTLLVGASTAIAESLLPRLLGEFNALYPRVRPRLIVANSECIELQLVAHGVDVAFVDGDAHLAGLDIEPCCEEELVVVCAPDYPLADLPKITPKALLEYEFISREPGSGTRQVTERYFHEAGVAPDRLKTLMELGSPESLKGVVATGLGFAILSEGVVEKERAQGSLVSLSLNPPLKRKLSLAYPQDKFRSRLVSTFVDFARQKMREMLF